jgi:hypothetical protein
MLSQHGKNSVAEWSGDAILGVSGLFRRQAKAFLMLWAFRAFWRENLKSFTRVEVVRRQTGREETTSDQRLPGVTAQPLQLKRI